MNRDLSKLTNIELYETIIPEIKQLCENFFYRDMKKYTLKDYETDLFFRLYDMSLEYEYSKTPDLYQSVDNGGEVFLNLGRGIRMHSFDTVRTKQGVDTYKQIKWLEVYDKVKEIWDEKHIYEFQLRYVNAPCHDHPYYYEPHILYDWHISENRPLDALTSEMLDNDVAYVMDHISEFPNVSTMINMYLKNNDVNELDDIDFSNGDDYLYFLLQMYHNLLNGTPEFNKNLEVAKDILVKIINYAEDVYGRQSARPFGLIGLAYYEAGKCYEKGILFEQSYSKARFCYLKAAQGAGKYYVPALGDMYYEGKGVDKNLDVAYMCYTDDNRHNSYAQLPQLIRLSKAEIEKKFPKGYEVNEDVICFDFEFEEPEWISANFQLGFTYEIPFDGELEDFDFDEEENRRMS